MAHNIIYKTLFRGITKIFNFLTQERKNILTITTSTKQYIYTVTTNSNRLKIKLFLIPTIKC